MEKQNLNAVIISVLKKTVALIIFTILITLSNGLQAQEHEIHHRLLVELVPEKQTLKGVDHIRIVNQRADYLHFQLSEKAVIKKVVSEGNKIPFQFIRGILKVPVYKSDSDQFNLIIDYEIVFDDPVPELPANTDNPGFGVSGTISEKGIFLLSGSGWLPVILNFSSSGLLTVKAPKGIIAVTAGKRLGEINEGDYTISRWEIGHPVRGLSLSAGNYHFFETKAGKVAIYAFLFPESEYLAKDYMDAAGKYIHMYESMFGTYPFPKFAIVENFFPTGYGFASYTLLGTQVLRLPFIIDTSLGHEIAHSWWGNGVYPDYSQGNWSEGLTTYVADYLFKERQSEKEARSYRLQMLRNYATLVNPSNDFPLADFTSRIDPVTKVIGYDKGAMFFHMLRKEVGEEFFRTALREIFARHLFQKTSWNDLRAVFEEISGKSLKLFFDQWINRKGAPQLLLEDVEFTQSSSGSLIKGKLVQKPPFFDLHVAISLETDREIIAKTISLHDESASFEYTMEGTPNTLTVDPDIDIFRKMYPSEIPPTINSLKASRSMLVVLADSLNIEGDGIAKLLMEGLGIINYQIVHEKNLQNFKTTPIDMLWIGMPSKL
ncbi:MAG: M1 family peptidase, partial [Desulfobacterales bacterium]|nr:M1 family peptidase [Desulfobacterales bacterium]